jgi:IPT/TIG domain-containing protein
MKSTNKRPTNSPGAEVYLTHPRPPRLVTPGVVALFVLFGGLLSAQAAPTITALSPTSGPVNTSVTITGTNFGSTQGTSTVKFHGTAATPTSWSATSIVVTVPAVATTGNVLVNVGGTNSNGMAFAVTPHISGLSLTTGPVQMGFVINGTTFGGSQGTSTVKIGTTALSVITWSASSITVQLPAGAATGSVVVTVASHASNGHSFTVSSPFGCT